MEKRLVLAIFLSLIEGIVCFCIGELSQHRVLDKERDELVKVLGNREEMNRIVQESLHVLSSDLVS